MAPIEVGLPDHNILKIITCWKLTAKILTASVVTVGNLEGSTGSSTNNWKDNEEVAQHQLKNSPVEIDMYVQGMAG